MKVQFNEKLSCFNISSIGLYVRSELFFEIVQGLDYLHTRDPKIIHRDLNLRNILVKKSIDRNNIKISDFGLSVEHKKKSDRNLNSQSHSSDVGTPKFMAPEIATGTTYNEKSDIYSLGLVLRLMFEWSELE
jgi:serine/threonine protein kinase